MLERMTKLIKRFVTTPPLLELCFNGRCDKRKVREVSIVKAKAADKFPNTLDGVEVRTIWWKEEQLKLRLLRFSPVFMHASMMIFGVIRNDHHTTAGTTRSLSKMAKKSPSRLGVELLRLLLGKELTVTQTNSPEIPHGFTGRMVQQDRVPHFWRNPHATARSVLLKMNFIDGPQVNVRIGGQFTEFFYMPLELLGRHAQSTAVVCADENHLPEKSLALSHL